LALFQSRSLDRDLQEELERHLALAAEEHLRGGLSPDEARRQAAIDLGGLQVAKARHRDARGIPMAESIVQDIAYALRGFRRNPGFTLTAVVILALGIGVNTAVFSIVRPLLLRPLPFRDGGELVWISPAHRDGRSLGTYHVGVFEELKRHSQSFSELSAYFAFFSYISYTLTGSDSAEGLRGVMVAPRFFELLGIRPHTGRFFSAEEEKPNGPPAAAALWRRPRSHRQGDHGQQRSCHRGRHLAGRLRLRLCVRSGDTGRSLRAGAALRHA
jgi:hypothetical protein